MTRHRPNFKGVTKILNAGKAAISKVNQRFRAGKTLLHRWKQGHAAGEKLCLIVQFCHGIVCA